MCPKGNPCQPQFREAAMAFGPHFFRLSVAGGRQGYSTSDQRGEAAKAAWIRPTCE